MGSRQEAQGVLFYEFSIEAHVPSDHTLRSVDQFVGLASIRQHLAPFYSSTGRPPGIGRVRLLRRSTTRSPASSERRSRYSLAILSGSLASTGSDYVARAAQTTIFSSPQPLRTSGNWPRSFLHRSNREKSDRKAARTTFSRRSSAPVNGCFSTESAGSSRSLRRCECSRRHNTGSACHKSRYCPVL